MVLSDDNYVLHNWIEHDYQTVKSFFPTCDWEHEISVKDCIDEIARQRGINETYKRPWHENVVYRYWQAWHGRKIEISLRYRERDIICVWLVINYLA